MIDFSFLTSPDFIYLISAFMISIPTPIKHIITVSPIRSMPPKIATPKKSSFILSTPFLGLL